MAYTLYKHDGFAEILARSIKDKSDVLATLWLHSPVNIDTSRCVLIVKVTGSITYTGRKCQLGIHNTQYTIKCLN